MATAEPGIKLIRSGPLPAGWMGKPHACWCGAMRAKADWICFVDADVRAAPGLMATAVAAADEQSVDLLSLSPGPGTRQLLGAAYRAGRTGADRVRDGFAPNR